jgi:hypothetical protein
MRYDIQIDNLIITADVHAYEKSSGYVDLDYTIERVLELDEDNLPYALDSKESDAILCGLENVVKTKLIEAIEKENEE